MISFASIISLERSSTKDTFIIFSASKYSSFVISFHNVRASAFATSVRMLSFL